MKYKCEICGKEYDTIKERSRCERRCVAAAEEDFRKKRAEALKAEKTKRGEEISAAISHLKELLSAYIEDYGFYKYESTSDISSAKRKEEMAEITFSRMLDNILYNLFN